MAPTADSATAAQKKTRKTGSRIVPAIPLALSRPPRSARPITPEDTTTEPVTQQDANPQPAVEKAPGEIQAHAVQDPLTPQSKVSGLNNGDEEVETPLSSTGALEETSNTRDVTTELSEDTNLGEDEASQHQPAESTVNGELSATSADFAPSLYPSETPSNQVPPSEAFEAPFLPPMVNAPVHSARPSLDNIIFGATQGSPAAPSTPHELESEGIAAHQPLPSHPPGFVPPQFAPPFYPGHSQHPSDHIVAWTPLAAGPVDGVHGHVQDFHTPQFPAQAMYQEANQIPISPHTPVATNGALSSHSQSPLKSQLGGTRPSSDHAEEPYPVSYQNGAGVPNTDGPPQSFRPEKFKEPYELAGYLTTQFGNPELADFVLRVRSEDSVLLEIPVHGIIVARSRTIAAAIHKSLTSAPRGRPSLALLEILTHDKFITPESLSEAIKVLYGIPMLTVHSFLYGVGPFHPDGDQSPTFAYARKRMSQAISYAAAGRFFRIHSMHERGLDMVKALLRWDTVEQALVFALLSRSSPEGRNSYPGHASTPDEYYAAKLLDDCADFIAYKFPFNFNLYTIAPEMVHAPRLPSIVERPIHNPRLSRIRFGDVPPEDELKPDYVTRMLSSILLSLPLPLLNHIFNHGAVADKLSWEGAQEVVQALVGERERRRQKALQSDIRISETDTGVPAKELLENMYWAERLAASAKYPSGFMLSETRLTRHA